jgi:hypothetical protein
VIIQSELVPSQKIGRNPGSRLKKISRSEYPNLDAQIRIPRSGYSDLDAQIWILRSGYPNIQMISIYDYPSLDILGFQTYPNQYKYGPSTGLSF